MSRVFQKLFVAALALATIVSCKKERADEEHNDNELITTVRLTFTEEGTNTAVPFEWRDTDGAGGEAPEVDEITLDVGKTYAVSVEFLDESGSAAQDITAEIEEEGDVHRVYYEPSGSLEIGIGDLDTDASNITLGLNSTWSTSGVTAGTVKITLRHYGSGGKAEDDPVNSTKSSTDAEVTFPVAVLP